MNAGKKIINLHFNQKVKKRKQKNHQHDLNLKQHGRRRIKVFVNPAHLIKERVKVEQSNTRSANPAQVVQVGEGDRASYHITVSLPLVNDMLRTVNIPKDYLILGFIYHEIAHIYCDSFKYGQKYKNLRTDTIHHWVTNIIEDTRIEYNLSYVYPYVAKFIALTALALKDKILTDAIQDNTKLEKQSQWLLKMVKLNIIPDDCDDAEFVEFMLPRILLARRGNRRKAEQIIYEIYQYLIQDSDMQNGNNTALDEYDVMEGQGNGEQGEATEAEATGESESEQQEGEQGQQATQDNQVDKKVEQLLKELQQAGAGGSGADDSVAEIVDDLVNANDFIRATIRNEVDNIKKVHKAFSEVITRMSQLAVKEGDLNIKRVQEAYLNQQLLEEGYDYHRPAKISTGFDCVIMRDISGSTGDSKEVYAKATCILAKALEELKYVRTQIIDFNGYAKVTKNMNQDLLRAGLVPHAEGGTNLSSAMELLPKITWKYPLRVIIVVTDGSPNDIPVCQQLLEKPEYGGYTWLPIVFYNEPHAHYAEHFVKAMESIFGNGEVESLGDINDLHKVVYKMVRKKVLKSGSKMSA